ncbi:SDR family oxidoreductase [Phytoactinopolyspora alkaliphila]|uniref:SDR family oxidoreductase n=1 Tax=Phytoactinopolyspora alkaliphila TaxID=1783498 RepID=A0A6N9YRE6_9ACTN|nr:SDR family oxidoreductase [Phytoactinopolyspora alkaliphila]NED97379.1 SDR family oxidoreductase [Phytoactinopolyspora alkaliphila]
MRILVAGASGYIGTRLVPRLTAAGHTVRCFARDPRKLRDLPWAGDVQIARGDVLDAGSVREAMTDIDLVYYLVHSLNVRDFAGIDRRAAGIVAESARERGVRRIVYLGGLHPAAGGDLSDHLASRAEVGEIFLRSEVPAVILQAAVIIGSGLASFEMLRYLTDRLPVSVTPRWVHTRTQPIAVRDVLAYLIGCAGLPDDTNRTFDIGGPDVMTYADMMRRYARAAGLGRRVIIPVPLLTPRLSAHWVNLITPVPRSIAVPLIDSLVHEAVCSENDIADFMPGVAAEATSYGRAVELALERIHDAEVESSWSKASTAGPPSDPLPSDPSWSGGSLLSDVRTVHVKARPERLWEVVEGIGGDNGWYSFPLAWAVRGWADRVIGGVGLRRGRRDPARLHLGDALDWWRVEELDHGRFLRLRAEMKVPGRAWLEIHITPEDGGAIYRQRAVFVPRGLSGQLYWWLLRPFHGLIFGGMARNITRTAARWQG